MEDTYREYIRDLLTKVQNDSSLQLIYHFILKCLKREGKG